MRSLATRVLHSVHGIDRRNMRRWIGAYLKRNVQRRLRGAKADGTRHLLFAVCDHYEPLWHQPSLETGDLRVKAWEEQYPRMADPFRDADGKPPQHSFFFAAEEYQPSYLKRLSKLVRAGYGEIELHLHHDDDTADGLREKLIQYLALLRNHGHLSQYPDGKLAFAFIHGNWCLANSRPDGRLCGVDDELAVLWESGMYADFTFPSAPDITQPPVVNEIYWPSGDLHARAAHERAEVARVGQLFDDRPLMIPGPLSLTWDRAARKPRIENGALTGDDPPTSARAKTWIAEDVHIAGREDWVFVKVHTHGATESTAASLLGSDGRALHSALASYNDGTNWQLHYVTAREMYNIALAAIDGHAGNPNAYRDFRLPRPPILR